ncbi:Por secretion system C-terminal sorting domain-containing protein [Cyclobacterium xiamenense]|uniref:Por secretion system C-terminal sorting domain-containing protein n=1 Tax=Cyclobacterium xiamenense TaxID=1297121 RepID=A0A1H6TGI7_9BACT|nr:T9SS type A sorting domain-containing protein [Cyclobacterium xiamenense]SEI74892.1 Por secretion system C-terminal sorting domain-containing protein [Cyclobacterium xiamenense]
MTANGILGSCCLVLLGLVLQQEALAQFRQLPLAPGNPQELPDKRAMRTQEVPLNLPFWDDFSSGSLSKEKWETQGAFPSYSIGINPPSLGVVYLDGVDAGGNPYSRNALENGEGDALTSHPIDLSGISVADEGSVYLSFFWQAGGRGEHPDAQDALVLSFLDAQGDWVPVWTQQGGEDLSDMEFAQEILPVPPAYQHVDFRFKFSQTGRLSGPFDTWVLDYVFLNKGRNAQDLFRSDRALTRLPGSPFAPYYAIPHFEFTADQVSGRVESQFKNLTNRFRAMEFTVELRELASGRLIARPDQNSPINPVPQALERRDFFSSLSEELELLTDSPFDLEVQVQLSAGDGFLVESITGEDTVFQETVDFRINDTSRIVIPFRDFYAYDDGSADYAAGINQRGGMLALQYRALNPGRLTGVSIKFTNALQRGNGIELMVWDSLENQPLLRQEVVIPAEAGPDGFAFFPIDTTVLVEDTFYVGYTQFSNDYLHLGLDKSGDTGERIFYNVLGAWQQNEEVRGNLMIRPHLSTELLPDDPGVADPEVRLYPNPVSERLWIQGEVQDVAVYDFQGREIKIPQEGDKNGKMLTFTAVQKGLYLIKYTQGTRVVTERIIVK